MAHLFLRMTNEVRKTKLFHTSFLKPKQITSNISRPFAKKRKVDVSLSVENRHSNVQILADKIGEP